MLVPIVRAAPVIDILVVIVAFPVALTTAVIAGFLGQHPTVMSMPVRISPMALSRADNHLYQSVSNYNRHLRAW